MKNYLIFSLLLLCSSIAFAQKTIVPSCFTKLSFTVQNYGKGGAGYTWGVRVTNNYSKAVQIRYKLKVGGEPCNGNGTLTYYIEPGGTYTNDWGKLKAIIAPNSSTDFHIDVSEVCFKGWDCMKYGYSDCNENQEGKDIAQNSSKKTNNSNVNGQYFNSSFDGSFDDLVMVGKKYFNEENYVMATQSFNNALKKATTNSQKKEIGNWIEKSKAFNMKKYLEQKTNKVNSEPLRSRKEIVIDIVKLIKENTSKTASYTEPYNGGKTIYKTLDVTFEIRDDSLHYFYTWQRLVYSGSELASWNITTPYKIHSVFPIDQSFSIGKIYKAAKLCGEYGISIKADKSYSIVENWSEIKSAAKKIGIKISDLDENGKFIFPMDEVPSFNVNKDENLKLELEKLKNELRKAKN